MNSTNIIFLLIGYILIFLMKKQFFALFNAILNSISNPIGFLINQLEKTHSVIENLNFTKIILNILVAICATFMLIAEFGALQGILDHAYHGAIIPGINMPISTINAIVYMSIATILGFLALEWLGMKKLLVEILFEKPIHHEDIQDWSALKAMALHRPQNTIKITMGVLFLGILFLFAYWQGELGILRDQRLYTGSTQTESATEIVSFLLGFFTPIVASISLLTIDIFVSIVCFVLVFTLKINLKLLSSTYYISQEGVNLLTGPVKLLTDKIDHSTNGKIGSLLKPMEVSGKIQKLNEESTLKNYIGKNNSYQIEIEIDLDDIPNITPSNNNQ
ncbi:MAG: hypothetical protein MI974_18830 [Chitinophagales bacterium]|nr:hypothetical protein [Chitinophagales bacterium]